MNVASTQTERIVVAVVEDLIQDWGLLLDEPVNSGSYLVGDLSFASVDIIQLCVALEQHYERKLGFQELLMVGGSYVSDLTVAQVAAFIDDKLANIEGTAR